MQPGEYADVSQEPNKPKKSSPWLWLGIALVALCLPCGAIFAAVLIPVFAQAKIAARQTATLSNLKHLGQGVLQYTVDYDDVYPPEMMSANTVWPFVSKYVTGPSARDSLNPASPLFQGVAALSAEKTRAVVNPAGKYMFYDSMPWPASPKRMVLFVDGHAKKVDEAQVQLELADATNPLK
ncbi:MAG: hypothetical protein JST30_14330 [Armatimonadetes bacterium]|nr:hypothetical protein [Armatimonadota bacterium]